VVINGIIATGAEMPFVNRKLIRIIG